MEEKTSINFTEEQKNVIRHSGGNLLVSASAGSGKTKVLIAKIVDLILNKQALLKQLLVVTFTNDASTEMKVRLSKELQNSTDETLFSQLDDLSVADILTFDKFCIKVVREFGYQIGITGNFGVADDSLSKFLQSKALDNIFVNHNKIVDTKFDNLLELFFDKRNETALKNSIVKVYNFLRSKGVNQNYYKDLLNGIYSTDFNSSEAVKYLNKNLLKKRDKFKSKLNELSITAQNLNSAIMTKAISECLEKIEVLNDDFEANLKYLLLGLDLPIVRNKFSGEEDDVKKEYASAKAEFLKTAGEITDELSGIKFEDIKTDMQATKQTLETLFDVVDEFDNEYRKLKNRYQVLDFNDLERYASIILQNEEIKTALQNRYKYIFIDEYQDTNDMQDGIISSITTGGNLFMVGDVKQSIYRFRQAEPQIFLNKYNLYKDFQTTNRVIELNKNFRSENEILSFANFVFDGIMTKENSGVDYKNTARLVFGENMKKSSQNSQVKLLVLNKTETEEDEQENFEYYSVKNSNLSFGKLKQIQREASLVAREILDMIGKNYYDASSKSYKKIDFSSIAILSRKKSGVMLLVRDILKRAKIPVKCEFSTKLFDNFDIQTVLNILKTVENSQNDIALISTLCTMGLSLNELAEIRKEYPSCEFYYECVSKYATEKQNSTSQKINNALGKIEKYRIEAVSKNLCELILSIVQNENLETYFIVNGMGDEFENNLQLLFQNIDSIKDYSLAEFVNYLDTFATDLSYNTTTKDSENAVTISTIHSSKGLEYPVVFLIDTGAKFSRRSTTEKVLVENDFGISTKSISKKSRFLYSSPVNLGFKLKIRDEERKEEMRLLYVALTRPKNFLTVVGTADLDGIKQINSSDDVLEMDSYLSWILGLFDSTELQGLKNNGHLTKQIENCSVNAICYDINLVDTSIAERKNSTTTCEQKFDGFYDIISKKFEKSNLVKKNSVTQIMAEEEHYNISDFSTKTTDKNGDDDFLLIGTAYHNIMEQLDFKNPNILEQIESLVVQNKIDVNNLKLIDTERIAIASKMLGKLIDQNDIVLKEQQFLSYMPASGLVRTQKTDKILVQGVADLIVIKQNEIYLVDYKTSRLSSEQSFKEKYSTQLNIYAKAIEDFYGKKVTKKIVYSFYLNKTIII